MKKGDVKTIGIVVLVLVIFFVILLAIVRPLLSPSVTADDFVSPFADGTLPAFAVVSAAQSCIICVDASQVSVCTDRGMESRLAPRECVGLFDTAHCCFIGGSP